MDVNACRIYIEYVCKCVARRAQLYAFMFPYKYVCIYVDRHA